jgi:hypothetical protein
MRLAATRNPPPLLFFAAASVLLLLQVAVWVFTRNLSQASDSISNLFDVAIVPCMLGGSIYLLFGRAAGPRATALALAATGLLINRITVDPYWPVLLLTGILTALTATVRIGSSTAPSPHGKSKSSKALASALAVLLLVHGAVSIHILRKTYPMSIDCFTFQQSSVRTLLSGHDPYGRTQLDIYDAGHSRVFYSPSNIDPDGRILVGLPYPPVTFLSALPGYLLGDIRYGFLIAILLSACLVFALMPDIRGFAVAAFLLLNPMSFRVEKLCWTEPLVWLLLCAASWAAVKAPRLLPIAAGLFLAVKQYNVMALPLLVLLSPFPPRLKRTAAVLAKAVIVTCATLLPFALWSPRGFWHDLVVFHVDQPFRSDALSFAVLHPWMLKLAGPLVLCYLALIAWRLRKNPLNFAAAYGVALLLCFAFSKQAFQNYYFLISLAFLLAGAQLWQLATATDCEGAEGREADAVRAGQRAARLGNDCGVGAEAR